MMANKNICIWNRLFWMLLKCMCQCLVMFSASDAWQQAWLLVSSSLMSPLDTGCLSTNEHNNKNKCAYPLLAWEVEDLNLHVQLGCISVVHSLLGIKMAMLHLFHKHQKSCGQVQKPHTLCCYTGLQLNAARKCPHAKACPKHGYHHSHFKTLCRQRDVVKLGSISKTNHFTSNTHMFGSQDA